MVDMDADFRGEYRQLRADKKLLAISNWRMPSSDTPRPPRKSKGWRRYLRRIKSARGF